MESVHQPEPHAILTPRQSAGRAAVQDFLRAQGVPEPARSDNRPC
ncbi:hypothetical protein [Kitasatospora humi]